MSYKVRNAKRAKAHFADTPRWQVDRDTERGPCVAHHDMRRTDALTLRALRAFCDVNGRDLEWAAEYGEPGYTAPERGILFANWNDIPKALQDRLESQGYELEWYDEWYVDSGRSPVKAWRTSPDGWDFEPRTRCGDGFMLTPDDDPQEWIDSSTNEEHEPLPRWFDTDELVTRGWGVMPDGTSHELAYKAARAKGFDVILARGSSDVFYDVWTRREAKRELFLSDARGQYIPRDFAQSIDRDCITGVDAADLDTLAMGPPGGCLNDDDAQPSEDYWDIWQTVCDNAVITAKDGTVYRIEQDGDCWLVESAGTFCEFDDTYYVTME